MGWNSPLLSARVRVEDVRIGSRFTQFVQPRGKSVEVEREFSSEKGLEESQTNAAFNRSRSVLQRPRRRRPGDIC
jgi:hypothetical protein